MRECDKCGVDVDPTPYNTLSLCEPCVAKAREALDIKEARRETQGDYLYDLSREREFDEC